MTDSSPLVRCLRCGWVHFGVPSPEPAHEHCFKCGGVVFEVIDDDGSLRGVTIQALRWPPLVRGPAIPKDELAAEKIADPFRRGVV